MDTSFYLFEQLALALLMGSLIGLERERNHKKGVLHEFGGIRTMALVTVFGFVVQSIFGSSNVMFAVLTGGYMLLLVASYVMSSYQNQNSGATTEVAGFFAYLIGVLVGMDQDLYATVITMLLVLILYFKQPLHTFAHRVGETEFYDTLKFVAIVFVVLPILPDKTFGPLDVLNPYQIWLVIVLISSISFASYVGIKALGPKRGIGVGGFLGGLISSTAVSMTFSELSKKSTKVVSPFVFAILIASSAMFIRVMVTVSVLSPDLLVHVQFPMAAMACTGFLFTSYYWFKKEGQPVENLTTERLNLESPFQLKSALKFGLFFAAMIFISKFSVTYFGNNGIYLTSFLSGIVDVDAISVSMANLSSSGAITMDTAATGITIAAMTNTLSKGVLVFIFGSRQVGRSTIFAMLCIIAVGLAMLSLLVLHTTYGFAFF